MNRHLALWNGLGYLAAAVCAAISLIALAEDYDARRVASLNHAAILTHARQLEHGNDTRRCDVIGDAIRCHRVQP